MRAALEAILEKLPDEFNMVELSGKAEERSPYQVVALQECERMNLLTQEMRRSLQELSLGLKVSRDSTSKLTCVSLMSGRVTPDDDNMCLNIGDQQLFKWYHMFM